MPSLANTLRSWVLMVCGGYAQLAGGIPVGRPVGDQFEDAQFRFRQAVPPGVRSLADDAAVYAKRIQVPSNAERVSGGAMGGIHVERDFQLFCGVVAICSPGHRKPRVFGGAGVEGRADSARIRTDSSSASRSSSSSAQRRQTACLADHRARAVPPRSGRVDEVRHRLRCARREPANTT